MKSATRRYIAHEYEEHILIEIESVCPLCDVKSSITTKKCVGVLEVDVLQVRVCHDLSNLCPFFTFDFECVMCNVQVVK